MGPTKAARAAAGSTANGPREFATMGKRRNSLATTFSPKSQLLARISARAERHLSDVEWRLSRLGDDARAGRADRRLVVERLRAAVVRAGLAKQANWGKKKTPEHCAAIASALKGKPKSLEACARMATAKWGTTRTPESVAKMVRTRRANGSYKPRSAALARAGLDQEAPR
jgi:hypothetical protein